LNIEPIFLPNYPFSASFSTQNINESIVEFFGCMDDYLLESIGQRNGLDIHLLSKAHLKLNQIDDRLHDFLSMASSSIQNQQMFRTIVKSDIRVFWTRSLDEETSTSIRLFCVLT
jgi:hypothetical protein